MNPLTLLELKYTLDNLSELNITVIDYNLKYNKSFVILTEKYDKNIHDLLTKLLPNNKVKVIQSNHCIWSIF